MTVTVGIPKGLLYYQYGQLWQNFLEYMGAQVLVSQDTTKQTLDYGAALDDVCLPAKVYFGHACELAGCVDYLFVPRVISVSKGQYTCPKIIGMPDLLHHNIIHVPPLIDMNVNLRQHKRNLLRAVIEVGNILGKSAANSIWMWYKAWHLQCISMKRNLQVTGSNRVALIGHPYMIHDRLISMDILKKLHDMDIAVVTPEMVPVEQASRAAKVLHKPLFWTYGQHMVGAALALMQITVPVQGIIFFTSFACGPDALVGEIIKQHAERQGVPFMMLTVDEHTAEAGVITRLEAFIDMLRWRW